MWLSSVSALPCRKVSNCSDEIRIVGWSSPRLEYGSCTQRLAGLGAIRYSRVESQERESRAGVEFRPLVCVDEIADVGLREQRCSGRQHVLQTVENLDRTLVITKVLEFAVTDETVLIAGRPCIAERQLQIVVDLLEAELVAQRVLVEIPTDLVERILLPVERSQYWLPLFSSTRMIVRLPVCGLLS